MLAAFGIILIVTGAIVAFAVDASVNGLDLEVLGYILMGGGALALLIAAAQAASRASMRTKQMHTERHVSSDGQHYVEDTEAV